MLTSVRFASTSLIITLACAALLGCSSNQDGYAGRVVDDTVTLGAPVITMPSVNLDVGFAPNAASTAGQRDTNRKPPALAGLGSVVRVVSVAVRAGEEVAAGQEIARLDARALSANVAVAEATLATARAQVVVTEDALETVASSRSTLASQRVQINNAAAQLASTRAKLAAQRAELKALLAKIEALGGGGGRPPVPPGGLPTGTVPPGGTPPGTIPSGSLPDPAKLRTGIAKLTAALVKIDAGLAKVSAGRAKLASASARLSDARRQLRDLRRLARVGVEGAKVGVRLAEYQRDTAVLRSPVGGTVVRVASVGDVLAPGATVAEIRRSGAPRVTTWLAASELAGMDVGTEVEVIADWFPAGPSSRPSSGRVSRIGTRAEYPPTYFATSEIHLTRAIPVEITLSATAEHPPLPAGTPVEVRFVDK